MPIKNFTEDSLHENIGGDDELPEQKSVLVDKELIDREDDENDGELIEDRMMEGGDKDLLDPLDEDSNEQR